MNNNEIEIKITLSNYDEIIQKLETIKKFLQETKEKETKKENYTLDDLKQKLINNLYNATYYEKNDIEILKILFENNDI